MIFYAIRSGVNTLLYIAGEFITHFHPHHLQLVAAWWALCLAYFIECHFSVPKKWLSFSSKLYSSTLISLVQQVKRGVTHSSSLIFDSDQSNLAVFTILACLTIISVLVAGVVLYSLKRNQNLKQRLRSLIGSLSGAEEGQEIASDYEV